MSKCVASCVILIYCVIFYNVQCLWPPSYEINLNHSEEFVIFETLGNELDDGLTGDEDEMIKRDLSETMHLEDKYYRIDKMSAKKNNKISTKKMKHMKPLEINHENEEPVPWMAGFFVSNSTQWKRDSKIYYLSETNENVLGRKREQKRQHFTSSRNDKETNGDESNIVDYEALRAEYLSEIDAEKKSNDTLDFIDTAQNTSFKHKFEEMFHFSNNTNNCTKGVLTTECLAFNVKKFFNKENKMRLTNRIFTILCVCLFIYLIIAIPCWCQRGWCCCCFRCRFCNPRQRIADVEKFMADNPSGIYHTINDEVFRYKPTHYEKYMQKRLEQAILKL